MKFSIWDKFKRCKKLEIDWHYLNPIPILRTSFPIPSGQIPVPVTPVPFSQPKNRPIPAPILPLHDPHNLLYSTLSPPLTSTGDVFMCNNRCWRDVFAYHLSRIPYNPVLFIIIRISRILIRRPLRDYTPSVFDCWVCLCLSSADTFSTPVMELIFN